MLRPFSLEEGMRRWMDPCCVLAKRKSLSSARNRTPVVQPVGVARISKINYAESKAVFLHVFSVNGLTDLGTLGL